MNQVFRFYKRVLSVLLAATLVVSSFQGMSITAYAAEDTVVIEEVIDTTAETEESILTDGTDTEITGEEETPVAEEIVPVEEGEVQEESALEEVVVTEEQVTIVEKPAPVIKMQEDTASGNEAGGETPSVSYNASYIESISYNGTPRDEDGRSVLSISEWEFYEAAEQKGYTDPYITDAVFEYAVADRRSAGETYQIVEINRSSLNASVSGNSVSKHLWNGVTDILDTSGDTSVRYNFAGGEVSDENWSFDNPAKTDAFVGLKLTMTPGAADAGVNVNFTNTAFPADSAWLSFHTDTWVNDSGDIESRPDYDTIVAAFGGADTVLAVLDAEGNEIAETSGNFHMQANEDGNNNVDFDFGNVMNLAANTDYTIAKTVYKGRIDTWEDGRTCLNISPGEAGKESFTADEIIAVLDLNAGSTFDEIYIEQPDGDVNTIPKAVLEKAATYLKEKADEYDEKIVTFAFYGNAETSHESVQWRVKNPEAIQTADQTVSATLEISEDNVIIFQVGEQSIAAERVEVAFGNSIRSDIAAQWAAILGDATEVQLELTDDTSANYSVDDYNAWINIHDIKQLTVDTPYEVGIKVYEGDVEEEDGKPVLFVDANQLNNDNDLLEAVLQKRVQAGEKYSIVTINFDYVWVSPTVWNAAVALLDNTEEAPILRIYREGYATFDWQWDFIKPIAVTDPIQYIVVGLEHETRELLGDGKGVKFSYSYQSEPDEQFPAERVDLEFSIQDYVQDYELFVDSIGNGTQIELTDSKGNVVEGIEGHTWSYTDGDGAKVVGIRFGDVQPLTRDEVYTIKTTPYAGEHYTNEVDGRTMDILALHPGDAGKEAFTVDELKAIMELQGEARFDNIYFATPTPLDGNCVIQAEVINLLQGYLKTEENIDTRLVFGFFMSNAELQWILLNPTGQETTDKTVSSDLNAMENPSSISVKNDVFHADQVDLSIRFDNATVAASKLQESLGTGQKNIQVGDGNQWGYYETTDESTFLELYNIGNLTDNTYYPLTVPSYSGRVETWDDGRVCLGISAYDVEKTSFTPEELIAILQMNAEQKFDVIYIEQTATETNTIHKVVSDKAYTILNEPTAGKEIMLQYGFVDAETESVTEWRLINPAENQEGDQTVKADLSISNSNQVIVNADAKALAADRVDVSFRKNAAKDSAIVNKIKEILGNSEKQFSLEGSSVYVNYGLNEWGTWLDIMDVAKLSADQNYAVTEYVYRGDINVFDGGRELYLDVNRLENGTTISDALQYYANANEKFDHISIQQEYSTNNIIRKEYINQARAILSTEVESAKNLTFVFCKCIDRTATTPFIQDDLNWTLVNPGEATKDINANVITKVSEDQGFAIKLNSNTYNADTAILHFYASPESETGKALQKSLGEAKRPDEESWTETIALKKGTTLDRSFWTYYGCEVHDENEPRLSLDIGEIQNVTPATEYLLVQAPYAGEMKGTTKLVTPEGASGVVFTSYVPEVATITGDVMTPVNNGEVYYSRAFVDKAGAKHFHAFHATATIALETIKLDKTELKLELPRTDEDYEVRGHIAVKYYPANAAIDMDPASLTWTTSNPAVVELVPRDWDGRFDGELRAVGAGEATIRATYNEKIYAECKVTVVAPVEVPEGQWPDAYAITNWDTKLSDVTLPTNWKWAEEADLALYAGMDGHDFLAEYTAADGRTAEYKIWVRLVTIEAIEMVALELSQENNETNCVSVEKPDALIAGESVVFNFDILMKNGGIGDLGNILGNRLKTTWSTEPSGIGTTEGLEAYWPESYKFVADTTTGQKTFTASLVDTKTGTVIATDSHTLTVTAKPVVNFDMMDIEGTDKMHKGKPGDTGTLYFVLPEDGYYPLTVALADSTVLELGETGAAYTDTEKHVVKTPVSYTIKDTGMVQFVVTAADEINSTIKFTAVIADRDPKIMETAFTINSAYAESAAKAPAAPVTIQFADWYGAVNNGSTITVVSSSAGADKFGFVLEHYENGVAQGYVTLKDASLKGNYDVTLKMDVDMSEDGEGIAPQSVEKLIKVKVLNKKPSVKVKQTKKVNTFYTSVSGNGVGMFTVTATNAEVVSCELTGTEDFVLIPISNTKYQINWKAYKATPDTEATLRYVIRDAVYGEVTLTKDIKIATEHKAPAIVLSSKSDTLYPNQDYTYSSVRLMNKATGTPIDISKAYWVADKKNNVVNEITSEGLKTDKGKNTFRIYKAEYDSSVLEFNLLTKNAATDKLILRVQGADWSAPVDATYSIKVSTKQPTLKLSSKKLTLNKNEDVYAYQSAQTKLMLAGTASDFMGDVRITAANDSAEAVLNQSLVVEYWGNGQIVTRLNDNSLDKGNYKYTVWAEGNGYKTSTTLTISVVDVETAKTLKVGKKGSIDLLRKDTTYMAYTPKIKNMAGTVVDAWLTGKDADMFRAEYHYESGQIRVYAEYGRAFSTKHNYKVKLVFGIVNDNGEFYEVETAEQVIKVKQGKPKAKITPVKGSTLYSTAGNALELKLDAILQNEDVAVSEVRLTNYTDDLGAWYDAQSGNIIVYRHNLKEIVTPGKTWKLNFNITYAEKAGNEKDAAISYKVIVK